MADVVIAFEGRWVRVVPLPTGEALLRVDARPTLPDAVLERVDLAHGRVALRAADGRYLARHAVHGPGPAALELVPELTPCAAFEELALPDGSVALRGCDLRFLGVHSSGAVVADRVTDGSRERFHWLEVPARLVRLPLQAGAVHDDAAEAAPSYARV